TRLSPPRPRSVLIDTLARESPAGTTSMTKVPPLLSGDLYPISRQRWPPGVTTTSSVLSEKERARGLNVTLPASRSQTQGRSRSLPFSPEPTPARNLPSLEMRFKPVGRPWGQGDSVPSSVLIATRPFAPGFLPLGREL